MRRLRLLALSAVLVLTSQAPALAQSSLSFRIEPQPLEASLLAFAAQAHAALSLPTGGFGGLRGRGITGVHKADDALSLLLTGTGYTFERVGDGAYRIVATRSSKSSLAPQARANRDVIIISAHLPSTEEDLPRDVSRIGGSRLVDAGTTSSADLATEISGLSFTNLGIGRNKILLRGLSDGALAGRTQSLVGLYFGDTRITYGAPDPDLQLTDIGSVEVLRGPQGALYGAGAIAGIMRITPNPVDLEEIGGSLLLAADTVLGGDPGRNVELVVNAPILRGALGVRGVFYSQQDGGWLDNPKTGVKNSNSVERSGVRVTAFAKLNPSWSIELGLTGQGITSDDSQYLAQSSSGLARITPLLEPHDNDFNLANLTIRGSTAWGDLTSSTSHVRHRFSSRFDGTGTFPSLGAAPGSIQPIDEQDALGVWVHETRLASASGGATPWFIGVFFADGESNRSVILRDAAFSGRVDYQEVRNDAVDELALFGEVNWPLAPRLHLSTGLRIFRSDLKMASASEEPVLSLSRAEGGHRTSTGVAPDIRLSYQHSSQALFYLSAARGFRADGLNSGGPIGQSFSQSAQPFAHYGDDDIWTYEAGARIELLKKKLALRVTGFDSEWRSVQTDELISNGFTYTGNVGDIRVTGLDFDALYAPLDGLLIRLNGLLNQPSVHRVNASFPIAPDGGLPGSPEYSGGGSARYVWSARLGPIDVGVFAELDAIYVGRSNLGFGNGTAIGDYLKADARLGITFQSWQAEIYVDNLSNSDGSTYSFGNPYQPGRVLVTPLRPRMVGLSLRRTF